jgi:SAM-dependent methyltransferase
MGELERLYERRFPASAADKKDKVWRAIGAHLQRYVPADGRVLDLACDRGDFIRNVEAGEKWASDIRDMSAELPADVRFVQADGLGLDEHLPKGYFDLVFMSNYLEHLLNSRAVIRQLQVCHQLLRPGGRVLVLQPNIRLVGSAYWDFIDHHVPLTEHSLVEAAGTAGFRTKRLITRFLPYSTKSRLPQAGWLVRAYLAFPPAWNVLGRQTLYEGIRP